MAHLIMIEPSATSLEISETFLIRNESNTTFQDSSNGTALFYPPKTAGDKVQVSVTPPTQMTIQRQAVKAAKPGSFKIDYPARPGETRFDMHYTLPASDTFSGKIVEGERPTTIVTPLSVKLSGDGIKEMGVEQEVQARLYQVTAPSYSVKIEGTGSIRERQSKAGPEEDTGQPKTTEILARVYDKMYWVLGLTFGNAGAGRHTPLPQGRGVNALEIADVWKYYGDFPALRAVALNIEPGSTLALLGRNGAGKTTLLRIIAGLSRPSRGSIKIQGPIATEATHRILGHGIALYDELSAIENLTLFGRLYGLPDPRKRADEMLERVGLARVRDGLGSRVFPRHAPTSGRRPGVSPRSRSAVARRAVHRARRPGDRRAPVHDPGHARSRPDDYHVHASAARSSGAGVARRAAPARPDRAYGRAHAADARRHGMVVSDLWRQLDGRGMP